MAWLALHVMQKNRSDEGHPRHMPLSPNFHGLRVVSDGIPAADARMIRRSV